MDQLRISLADHVYRDVQREAGLRGMAMSSYIEALVRKDFAARKAERKRTRKVKAPNADLA